MLEQQPILNLPGKQILLYIFSFLKLKKPRDIRISGTFCLTK